MANLVPFLAYVFVTTFTPGPNNIMAMSNAMRSGYKKTLGFLVGIFAGFWIVMLICGLLNFLLVELLPQAKFWLNILGAAYMLGLAFHVATARPSTEGAQPGGLNTLWAGFSMQFLNLKVILYGVTIYSNFIAPAFQAPLELALFAPLLALIGFLSVSCWALGGELFRRLIHRHERAFNLAMAALLIYVAVASLV
jgi:threonine/homoserine/homoserine lactone efflux protein